jgi:putative ABC transport system ATP-binding protein
VEPVLSAHEVSRSYADVLAVDSVSLTVSAGELVAVVGPSGSGKTTLLNLMAGLDDPDSGEVHIEGQPLAGMSESERARIRRESLGFVFQRFGLMPTLSAVENVGISLRTLRTPAHERERRSREALGAVGLAERIKHRPGELSGGERQRVAIARALVHQPRALLCDEPTGELDTVTGAAILALLRQAADEGTAVLIATHDPRVRSGADRSIVLHHGRVDVDATG